MYKLWCMTCSTGLKCFFRRRNWEDRFQLFTYHLYSRWVDTLISYDDDCSLLSVTKLTSSSRQDVLFLPNQKRKKKKKTPNIREKMSVQKHYLKTIKPWKIERHIGCPLNISEKKNIVLDNANTISTIQSTVRGVVIVDLNQ